MAATWETFASVDDLPWREDQEEAGLRNAFLCDCPERHMVSLASNLLSAALEDTPTVVVPPQAEDDPAAALLLAAQIHGARVFRSVRAGAVLLSAGYESEARGLARVLVELDAHRYIWTADSTGKEAMAWLEGKRARGVTKTIGTVIPREAWGEVCTDVHGDPRSLLAMKEPSEDGGFEINYAPRRTIRSRVFLMVLRDLHACLPRSCCPSGRRQTREWRGKMMRALADLDTSLAVFGERLKADQAQT